MLGKIRGVLAVVFLMGIMVLIGWGAYNQFAAPDASVVLTTRATNAARRAIIEQDWNGALSVLAEANEKSDQPDWELMTWYAVLSEKQGTASDGFVEQALTLAKPDDVWITYGMVAVLANEPTLVLNAGQTLIDQNPDSVQGYFLMAQAHDIQDELETALQYYGLTLNKIDQVEGHEGIYITVRQRVAQINIELMQEEVICC